MKARDFVQAGEQMMVIFTRGGRFELRSDHTGSTGNWVIDTKRHIDRGMVYHRDGSSNKNKIYLASFVAATPTDEEGRYNVELAHIQYAGESELNWKDFADTGTYPVRYIG